MFLSELPFAAQHKNTRKIHKVQRESEEKRNRTHFGTIPLALFDFRIHHLDDDPGSQRKSSNERLPLGDAVHLVGALGKLLEDLLFLIVQPLLQILLVPYNVSEQFGILATFLKVPLAWADVSVP